MKSAQKQICKQVHDVASYTQMSAVEVLEHLSKANSKELAMVRDTAESLLTASQMTLSEDRELESALAESEAQFRNGEGIPATEAWRKLGL